jgi:hypothetical protein
LGRNPQNNDPLLRPIFSISIKKKATKAFLLLALWSAAAKDNWGSRGLGVALKRLVARAESDFQVGVDYRP